jgi:hypothetical protein
MNFDILMDLAQQNSAYVLPFALRDHIPQNNVGLVGVRRSVAGQPVATSTQLWKKSI